MKPRSQRKKTDIDFLLFVVVLLNVAQQSIHSLPEFLYRVSESGLTDALFCAFGLACLLKTSYRHIYRKSGWFAVVGWYTYSMISNLLTQFVFDNPTSIVLLTLSLSGLMIIIFSLRFLFRWKPYKEGVQAGVMYLVVSRPESITQLFVAVYTGLGGAFGITDAETGYWHYSSIHGSMVRDAFHPSQLNGKMLIKIGFRTTDKINELNAMTGRLFGLLHNCLEILTLAKKWGTV